MKAVRDNADRHRRRYMMRERALVPAPWRWEVQNVFRNAERRGRISDDTTSSIRRSLIAMPLSVDPASMETTFGAELRLARRFALTVYDAAYLELAGRRSVPLAARDAAIRAAAAQLDLLWKPR